MEEEPTDDGLTDYERDQQSDDSTVQQNAWRHKKAAGSGFKYGHNRYYDIDGNRIPSAWGVDSEVAEEEEDFDVWDEPSLQRLQELKDIESGAKKTPAEEQAYEMAAKIGTATRSMMKSRRGVAPGAAFGTGVQQQSMVKGIGRTAGASIGKTARRSAGQEILQFQAAKFSEERGIAMQVKAQNQAAEQAQQMASAGLFGSFMTFLGAIAGGLIASGGSDKRIKTNVDSKRGTMDLMEFLNGLETATYDKHLLGLTRHETGIMAQSAEKSKVGRQFVQEYDGIKVLNPTAATGPILASLKLLHDRIGSLEKPKKKKQRGKK